MASTTALPTVPGVTAEQVERALAVAQRVYDDLGVPVRLEAQLYKDPELSGPPVVEIAGYVDEQVASADFQSLIHAVPEALRKAGLYEPRVPITTAPFLEW